MFKKKFGRKVHLYCGQEAMTDNGHKVFIDSYNEHIVWVRHVEEGWPFPHWDFKTRKQLTPVPVEYEEAPF